MSLPPAIFPAKRRVHRKAKRAAAPPPVALALVSVEIDVPFDGADGEVRLLFNTTADNPLSDVSGADPLKWTCRYDGIAYDGQTVANETFNTLLVHFGGAGADAGPDEVNYSNAPSDVSDSSGRPLAAFSGFPL